MDVHLAIDSSTMLVNGKEVSLDAPARLRDDRTFVPLRVIAEAFGKKVDWSQEHQTVFIGETPKNDGFYKVVYYYGNEAPDISDYTLNIATYTMDMGGKTQTFQTLDVLLNTVEEDFVKYYTTGKSVYGVSTYREKKPVVQEEKNTVMEKENQLKDDYYVKQTQDSLVGTYYGPGSYNKPDGSKKIKRYVYVTSLGNNWYLIKNRTILASDPSSEYFTEQYGTFDPATNILYVEESHKTTGGTGIFKEFDVFNPRGKLYLVRGGTRLSWDEPNNPYIYYDKY